MYLEAVVYYMGTHRAVLTNNPLTHVPARQG
jgi:hypothetical protein